MSTSVPVLYFAAWMSRFLDAFLVSKEDNGLITNYIYT